MSSSLVNLVSKCPKEAVNKFLHGIIDGLANRPSLEYSAFSEVWSLDEWFEVTDQTTLFFKSCAGNGYDQESICKSLDGLDENLRDIFVTVLKIREQELEKALKEKSIAISSKHLQDFDWKVKLVLASDKLANIHEPLTTLDLDIRSEDKSESISLELDKEQLKSLITSLEAANRAVQHLSSQ